MLKILLLAAMVPAAIARAQGNAQSPPAAEAAPPDEGDRPLGEEEAMVLNFERADIRDVIHSLATALGLSYTIDPRIEGQVTLRTTGKIPREDLFPLFNQILRNNGIAAVKVDDIYQILPVGEAKTRAIVPRSAIARQSARSDDSFVIEIIPVHHVSSDEMVNILQPFVTPGGDVLSYPRANLVVVTDLQSNVARLKDLVDTFDTDVFRNLRTRVFKVVHGDPQELSDEIMGLLAPYGVTASAEGENGVYVIPLSRLNSLVVVAFDPAIFDEIERWLKLLDIPPEEGAGRQTFVYSVENAKAADLAAVLNELFGGGPGGGGGGVGGRVPGAPPSGVGLFGAGGTSGGRTGLGGGRAGTIGGAGAIGQPGGGGFAPQQAGGTLGGGAGMTAGGRTGGGRLGGRGAGGLGAAGAPGQPGAPGQAGGQAARGISLPGRAGAGAPGQPGGPEPIFKEEVRIVADEVTNSLVILATRRDYQLILDVVKRIDVVPRQVLLEVTIAEVTLNKMLEYGIAYAISSRRLGTALPGDENASIFSNRGDPNGTHGAPTTGGLLGTAVRTPAQGAFAVITNRDNFNIFINALASRTNVKMLSAPHVIAADNREAHILVGDSIPILTSTATSTGITGTVGATVNAVQYRDTGTILTILPQVNSKGLVNMQLRQEVSAVGTTVFGNTNSPSFSTREAETTVVVQDGETVVIGGIINDAIEHDRTGIPYLMDVPVLGRAFRMDTDTTKRTELLILISPYVIRNREEAREVTDEFSDRLEGLKRLAQMVRSQHDRYTRKRERGRAERGDDGAGTEARPTAAPPPSSPSP